MYLNLYYSIRHISDDLQLEKKTKPNTFWHEKNPPHFNRFLQAWVAWVVWRPSSLEPWSLWTQTLVFQRWGDFPWVFWWLRDRISHRYRYIINCMGNIYIYTIIYILFEKVKVDGCFFFFNRVKVISTTIFLLLNDWEVWEEFFEGFVFWWTTMMS